MTDLSISVVSYRTPDLLRACLTRLAAERTRGGLDFDVTVVDNASGDASADMVATEFNAAWVRLIRNPRNVGFGAAHNQALRFARGRHLLVLNSDAVPVPGALQTLVSYLDAHPDVGIVGPKLRHPDGRVQPSRRRFPTPATLFFESTQLQRFWPRTALLDRFYVADRSDDAEQEVDWVVGACLAVNARAAAQVGLFDARYFLYSEETDWCRRMRAAGWRVMYLPSAEVEHLEGGSTRLDLAARDKRFQTSKLRYAARWHAPGIAHALRAYLVLEYVARFVEEAGKLALGSRPAERRARLPVILAGLRHILGRHA